MTDQQNIYTFKTGLPGLPEDLKDFNLIAIDKDSPFYLLQSTKDEEICFIVINPFLFFPGYEFDISNEEKTKLDLENNNDIAVFCIVNASEGLKTATVNLLAPIVVNTATGAAKQVVLNDQRYTIRQPLPLSDQTGEG